MQEINYGAVAVATIAAFIVSSVYYGALAKILAKYSKATKPSAKQAISEIVRSLVVVLVIAQLVHLTGGHGWGDAARTTILLWIGFPVILLSGSVMYEKTPYQLALLHAGDWLVKLFVVTAITTLWS